MTTKSKNKNISEALKLISGADNVVDRADDLQFYSSDLYQQGPVPSFVVRPSIAAQVADLVGLARETGLSLHVRGGGMSYSNAFLPERDGAIVLDMTLMDQIRKIDAENLFVTVEAGCTWKNLDEALLPFGLRSVFWGPASGASATVGGAMSQGTANNQSAGIETSSNAVLSYEIVTGTGEVLHTGLDAQAGRLPTYRPYGPDLTAIFSADAGSMGIKTAVTLKLEPRPVAEGGVSFAFESFDALRQALRSAGGTGIASAIIAMDAETAGIRSGETGLKADIQKLVTIVQGAHNPFRGVVRGTKIALAGRRVFEEAKYTAHFLAEGQSEALLAAKERELRKVVKEFGSEIPSAAISMMRANLFPDLPTTDFIGRRMLPIHGLLAWSNAQSAFDRYKEIIGSFRARLDKTGVTIADVFTVLGRNTLLFEPVFYWNDSLTPFHHKTRPDTLGPLETSHPDNPDARALVEEMKGAFIKMFADHGAAHLQIGKLYPFMRGREASSSATLANLKALFDPDNIINTGALGVAPSKDVK